MIVKTKTGKYIVKSSDGKKTLSKPMSLPAAKKRLAEIEYFKKKSNKK